MLSLQHHIGNTHTHTHSWLWTDRWLLTLPCAAGWHRAGPAGGPSRSSRRVFTYPLRAVCAVLGQLSHICVVFNPRRSPLPRRVITSSLRHNSSDTNETTSPTGDLSIPVRARFTRTQPPLWRDSKYLEGNAGINILLTFLLTSPWTCCQRGWAHGKFLGLRF